MIDNYSVTEIRERARLETVIEMAKKLLRLGDSIDKVQVVTKLSKENIQELKRELGRTG